MDRSDAAHRREENEVEFSRIVAFSDGVFAIAITLLVLSLEVPTEAHGQALTEAIWDQRDSLFAYALSFAVIGRFWVVHHRFFGDVIGFDGRLLALNLFYLAWIVLIPFSSAVLGDHGGEAPALVLYAGNLLGVTLVGMWMTTDARRAGLTKAHPDAEAASRRRALLSIAIFVVSIPLALVVPDVVAFVWLTLFLAPLAGFLRPRG